MANAMTGRYVIYADEVEQPYGIDADEYARRLQAECDRRGWSVDVQVRRGVTGVGSGWCQTGDLSQDRDELGEAEEIRDLAGRILETLSEE